MKTLLILRHAKSSWKETNLSDHDRPLNPRGRRDAPKIGKLIREKNLEPQLILSSTAERARDTVERVTEACGYEGELRFIRDLYMAGPEAYIEALNELDDAYQRVMVVGHNPGLETLLEVLTGEPEGLPTAALAQVTFLIHTWRELDEATKGKLVALWVPRQLSDCGD